MTTRYHQTPPGLFTRRFLLALLLALPLTTQATEIDGIAVTEVLPPTAERPALLLNGAAKRKFFTLVDVYVGALYVEQRSQDPAALLTQDRYRRMEFNMLRNVRGGKIADAFYEGIRLNLSQQEAEAIQPEIQQLTRLFDQKLSPGDQAVVEYLPGEGTHVVIAGRDRGIIPGKALFDAVLSIWIGEYPVSADFKAGILGVTTPEAPRTRNLRRTEHEF